MLRQFVKNISYLIAPPYCVCCGVFLDSEAVVCEECSLKIKPIVSHCVQVTDKHSVKVFSLSSYEGIVRSLILKKHLRLPVGSKQLGILMANRIELDWKNYDYIVPVPLHWTRYASRGFNQAKIISKQISEICGIEVFDCVKRIRKTRYQTLLKRQMRRENVKKSFLLKKGQGKLIKGKRVLIVDDTMTTGSTIKEVANTLFKWTPASITVVVAARVL